MQPELIIGLFNVFAPIVSDIVKKHQAANNGALPTDAEITATFAANIDKYIGEGAAWRASHPNA